jgi:hypothetical protein
MPGQTGFAVGKAGAGINLTGSRFQVVAANLGRGDSGNSNDEQRQQDRKGTQHGIVSFWVERGKQTLDWAN